MAVTINASTSSGLQITSDTSGAITFQKNGSSTAAIDASSNLQFNSGYGSVATAYGCRAWINFDGSTASPTIRASANITSITDNGAGEYALNFTVAMPDANFAVAGISGQTDVGVARMLTRRNLVSSSVLIFNYNTSAALTDQNCINIAIFR